MSNLFQQGTVTLHSGAVSDFKIECDALTDADWQCLAFLISQKFSFSHVIGVPNGGYKLQDALLPYADPASKGFLIVDDVLTTGRSMEDWKETVWPVVPQGVVIFARGKCPDWITPIFQLTLS